MFYDFSKDNKTRASKSRLICDCVFTFMSDLEIFITSKCGRFDAGLVKSF